MKRVILSIAAVLSLAVNSFAQENTTDFRDKLTFGLKAGLNFSNVYDAKGEEFTTDPKFGLAAGAALSIPIGKYIGIQPEVLFSQKGFVGRGKILGSGYSVTRTSDFIDVPVLFTFKPSEFISIVAGPQYSFLAKQTDVFANATTTIEQEKEFENDNIRKNTFCFTGGIDINLKHIVLGARVGWDVQNNNGDGTSSTPRYKNVWYQGTIGYRFYRK
ncbi:MAG: PorT family protein [Bacteroidetes bacterium]|nr:PorT family protein [Bacteroidota bacterium]